MDFTNEQIALLDEACRAALAKRRFSKTQDNVTVSTEQVHRWFSVKVVLVDGFAQWRDACGERAMKGKVFSVEKGRGMNGKSEIVFTPKQSS